MLPLLHAITTAVHLNILIIRWNRIVIFLQPKSLKSWLNDNIHSPQRWINAGKVSVSDVVIWGFLSVLSCNETETMLPTEWTEEHPTAVSKRSHIKHAGSDWFLIQTLPELRRLSRCFVQQRSEPQHGGGEKKDREIPISLCVTWSKQSVNKTSHTLQHVHSWKKAQHGQVRFHFGEIHFNQAVQSLPAVPRLWSSSCSQLLIVSLGSSHSQTAAAREPVNLLTVWHILLPFIAGAGS